MNGTAYYGHWVQLQLPVATCMYSYTLTRGTSIINSPTVWYVCGSTDGINWNMVHTRLIADGVNWDANTTALRFYVGSQTAYQYYRLIINRIQSASSASAAIISGFNIFGDSYPYTGLRLRGKFDVGGLADTTASILTVDPSTSRVGIGSTSPTQLLDVNGGAIRCSALSGAAGGTLVADANGVIGYSFSDAALKTEVEPMTVGLDEIRRLKPVNFQWKDAQRFGARRQYGLIAQEVADVIPDLVGQAADGYNTLDYVKLVPILIKAVQDLSAQVDKLVAAQP